MNELALFAGAGGGIIGGLLHGWRTVAAVEIEDYPRRVLLQRQSDGILPRFPIWDDVRTFDGKPWRGKIDVVSGGFPCQDISSAGKGAGINGKRSGLWKEMARIIGEVRPPFVFVENSPMLIHRGLAVVLGDLAQMGYDAEWCIVSAADVGAPHKRDRIWIVANTGCGRCDKPEKGEVQQQGGTEVKCASEEMADANSTGTAPSRNYPGMGGEWKSITTDEWREKCGEHNVPDSIGKGLPITGQDPTEQDRGQKWGLFTTDSWWETEPSVGRVADGVAHRVDRLKAIGNGQVPLVAAKAWAIMTTQDQHR